MSERINHPSFANLYIGRSQCSGKKALFGSSIKHHDTITLKISPAYLKRNLNVDTYFADANSYIEIEMSEAQCTGNNIVEYGGWSSRYFKKTER